MGNSSIQLSISLSRLLSTELMPSSGRRLEAKLTSQMPQSKQSFISRFPNAVLVTVGKCREATSQGQFESGGLGCRKNAGTWEGPSLSEKFSIVGEFAALPCLKMWIQMTTCFSRKVARIVCAFLQKKMLTFFIFFHFFHFFQELVRTVPSRRNWKGILLALLVISVFCAIIITAIVLVTPSKLALPNLLILLQN